VLYMTFTTWLENLALARSAGTYLKFRDKCAKPDAIILYDFGMRKLTATEAQDLCEILEERSIASRPCSPPNFYAVHCVKVVTPRILLCRVSSNETLLSA